MKFKKQIFLFLLACFTICIYVFKVSADGIVTVQGVLGKFNWEYVGTNNEGQLVGYYVLNKHEKDDDNRRYYSYVYLQLPSGGYGSFRYKNSNYSKYIFSDIGQYAVGGSVGFNYCHKSDLQINKLKVQGNVPSRLLYILAFDNLDYKYDSETRKDWRTTNSYAVWRRELKSYYPSSGDIYSWAPEDEKRCSVM